MTTSGTAPENTDPDTYAAPEHGWACYHCGTTFLKPGAARLHLGPDPGAKPACTPDMGALMDLRDTEHRVALLQTALNSIADRASPAGTQRSQ